MTPRFQHLASIVSSQFGIGSDEIMGDTRPQSVASARFALYALAVHDGMSVHEVTTTMGKARGTVFYGIKQHQALMDTIGIYRDRWLRCAQIAKGCNCPHCGKEIVK